MKKIILMVIAFSVVVLVVVGCQPKAENNTPPATNSTADQGMIILTNSVNTNTPGATNQ